MTKILECVPNFSEGRRQDVIDQIIEATKVEGAKLIDINTDTSFNRTVLTLVGEPEAVLKAVFQSCKKATELIDMNVQSGQHPRIGATDVIPFIPVQNMTMEECVELANELGNKISSELNIPIYMYESAAKIPSRKKLGDVRKGDYEGLKEEIENPERHPDYGAPVMHPTAGATAIGVRDALIAFNINLGTNDVKIAKKIANTFREARGGFKDARAIGVSVEDKNIVQVSTMINPKVLPLHRVLEMVKSEASRYGVNVTGSEVISLLPRKALMDAGEFYLRLEGFEINQVLEENL